jgi:hypothetical protein
VAGRSRFAKDLIADLRDLAERPRAISGFVLGLVGTALVTVGLLGAVLVGPDSTWTAARTVAPGAPAVVITPGVVGAIGPQVTVLARRSDGQELFVGRAIASDVSDLTRATPRLLVRGVRPLHRLVTTQGAGSTSLPPVGTSDIWRETSIGRGARSLSWRPDAEPQSILVATTDGAALPSLRLQVSWHRSGWFPGAVLLLLVGLGLLSLGLHRRTGRRLLRGLVDRALAPLEHVPMPARRGRRREPGSEVVR